MYTYTSKRMPNVDVIDHVISDLIGRDRENVYVNASFDQLLDAYEAALDLTVFLRSEIIKRETNNGNTN